MQIDSLNKYACPRSKVLPELLRGARFLLFKDPVEIGDIVEAAVIGYLGNRMGSIDQHAGSMAQPYFVKAVDEGISSPFFNEPAKGNFGHAHQFRNLTQGDCLVIIMIHVFKCLLDAPAVVGEMFIGKRGIGKGPHIPGDGQIVKDRKQFQHGIESIFLI